MKKLIISILLLLSTYLHAGDFDSFIGVEAGSTYLTFDPIGSQRGGEYGLRLGFIKDTGRVFLSVNSADLDNADLNSLTLNFDAITPRAYRFNESFSIRGLVGAHGGIAQIKSDVFNDDEGVTGGAKAGIFLDFPANISIEVGYKFSWTSLEPGTESVKNYQTVYAAYNYTF